jgi:hypothetical protein
MIVYALFNKVYSMWFIPIIIALQKKGKKNEKSIFIRLWLAYLSCFHPFCVSLEKNKNEKACQFLHLVMPSELKSFNIKMPFDSTIVGHLLPKFLAPCALP